MSIALCVLLLVHQAATAVPSLQQNTPYPHVMDRNAAVLYAQVDSEADSGPDAEPPYQQIESGTLVLPAALGKDRQDKAKKQCMTVCGRWGEECIFINRGTGGTTKKCRRACKNFVEECF